MLEVRLRTAERERGGALLPTRPVRDWAWYVPPSQINLELDSELEQPYNEALAHRDEENGYPKLWKTLETDKDTPKEKKSIQSYARKYIDSKTGAFKT